LGSGVRGSGLVRVPLGANVPVTAGLAPVYVQQGDRDPLSIPRHNVTAPQAWPRSVDRVMDRTTRLVDGKLTFKQLGSKSWGVDPKKN
jgi:hypothetical protein